MNKYDNELTQSERSASLSAAILFASLVRIEK